MAGIDELVSDISNALGFTGRGSAMQRTLDQMHRSDIRSRALLSGLLPEGTAERVLKDDLEDMIENNALLGMGVGAVKGVSGTPNVGISQGGRQLSTSKAAPEMSAKRASSSSNLNLTKDLQEQAKRSAAQKSKFELAQAKQELQQGKSVLQSNRKAFIKAVNSLPEGSAVRRDLKNIGEMGFDGALIPPKEGVEMMGQGASPRFVFQKRGGSSSDPQIFVEGLPGGGFSVKGNFIGDIELMSDTFEEAIKLVAKLLDPLGKKR